MLKFTKSCIVLVGRVFFILSGLVLFSLGKALNAFFFNQSESTEDVSATDSWTSVNDLQSAQASFSAGESDESTIAHYWATEDSRK